MYLFSFFYIQTASQTGTICQRCFLFSLYIFSFFVKDQVSISVQFYFWVFNPIPLINASVCLPIPCSFYHYFSVVKLEVRDGDSPSCSLIVKNCFCYSGFFAFPDEFENCSFHVFEELCWDFDGDSIESIDCFW